MCKDHAEKMVRLGPLAGIFTRLNLDGQLLRHLQVAEVEVGDSSIKPRLRLLPP